MNIVNKTLGLALASTTAFMLGITPAMAEDKDSAKQPAAASTTGHTNDEASTEQLAQADKIGGRYFVTAYRGLPGLRENARPMTAMDIDQLGYLEDVCDDDMKLQSPNAVLEVGHDVVISAGGSALGVGGGAVWAFGKAVSGVDYAKYGAGAGGGGGLFAGISGRGHAKKYDIGQCMSLQVQWAQKFDGQLTRKGIVLNSHSINGRPIKRSQVRPGSSETDTDSSHANDDGLALP